VRLAIAESENFDSSIKFDCDFRPGGCVICLTEQRPNCMKKSNLSWFVLAVIACSAPLLLAQNLATGQTGNLEEIVASQQRLKYEGGGKQFEVVGHDDQITITGECAKLEIVGHHNKIVLDAVGEIQATGNNNLVTYRRGLNGASPKVQSMGASNKIVAAPQ
jgi:Protein of unknown function (DUF3060)